MRERLRNGYTQTYAQIMQHTHTDKAVTRRVEAKKLLSRRRQSNYSRWEDSHHIITVLSQHNNYMRSFAVESLVEREGRESSFKNLKDCFSTKPHCEWITLVFYSK